MKREEKEAIVKTLVEKIEKAKAVFFTDFRGVTVHEMNELRNKLRKANAEYKVVKNTLIRRALDQINLLPFDEIFDGPIAIATTSNGDPVTVAKTLTEFAKEHPKLRIKGGLLEKKKLLSAEVSFLSELPPKEILISKLLMTMQSPISNLLWVLKAPIRNFVNVLSQIQKQKE